MDIRRCSWRRQPVPEATATTKWDTQYERKGYGSRGGERSMSTSLSLSFNYSNMTNIS